MSKEPDPRFEQTPKIKEAVFKIITDRIIALLDKDIIPWQKPWKSASFPINLFTNKEYRGINVILLIMAGFTSPYWLTAHQAEKLGGEIKKGEVGTEILFWGRFRAQKESSDDVEEVPFKKFFTVYNISQCEGISAPPQGVKLFNPIHECERIINQMPNRPSILHGGNIACYSPSTDQIRMPEKGTFNIEHEYYCTIFHELCHATGHETRLNRKSIVDIKPFGTEDYSKEELIAEMGASFLCGLTGIENRTIENSAAYIAEWLKKLRRCKTLLPVASQQAQKAVDYIRGKARAESEEKPQKPEIIPEAVNLFAGMSDDEVKSKTSISNCINTAPRRALL